MRENLVPWGPMGSSSDIGVIGEVLRQSEDGGDMEPGV